MLQGKTFTLDPISKRRLANFGEEDQFYIRNHHEPIISREVFESAQEILKRRGKPRRIDSNVTREKYTRKFAFSCMIKCGFCGRTLTRRHWNSGKNYSKNIWQCVSSTKGGKKTCPHSKGVEEDLLQKAFLDAYNLIRVNDKDVLESFLAKLDDTLMEDNIVKKIEKAEKEITHLESKKSKLLDMKLEGLLSNKDFEDKYYEILDKIESKKEELTNYNQSKDSQNEIKNKIRACRNLLEGNGNLEVFDRFIFESIVEKVIVGGFDEYGNMDPYLITFVLKIGKSIFCLNEGEMGAQRSIILSSVYTNYASCLTMMHRYEEAEDALRLSCEVLPEQKGRDTVIAILMAAKGDSEGAYNILNVIETQLPDIYNTTKKMVDDILDKKHPHFNAVAVPEERITSFWDWFVSNEVNLLQCLENKDYDTVFNLIQDELKKLFPFVERNLELGIEPKSDCYQIIFADFFMVSLKIAYRKLIDAVPQSLKKRWAFDIAR